MYHCPRITFKYSYAMRKLSALHNRNIFSIDQEKTNSILRLKLDSNFDYLKASFETLLNIHLITFIANSNGTKRCFSILLFL